MEPERFAPTSDVASFTCFICLLVPALHEARWLPCRADSNVVCVGCLREWAGRNGKCPLRDCEEPLTGMESINLHSRALVPTSGSVARELRAASAAFRRLQLHCGVGCGALLPLEELALHEAEQCPEAAVACAMCDEHPRRCAVPEHEAVCAGRVISCPRGCGQQDRAAEFEPGAAHDCVQHLRALLSVLQRDLAERQAVELERDAACVERDAACAERDAAHAGAVWARAQLEAQIGTSSAVRELQAQLAAAAAKEAQLRATLDTTLRDLAYYEAFSWTVPRYATPQTGVEGARRRAVEDQLQLCPRSDTGVFLCHMPALEHPVFCVLPCDASGGSSWGHIVGDLLSRLGFEEGRAVAILTYAGAVLFRSFSVGVDTPVPESATDKRFTLSLVVERCPECAAPLSDGRSAMSSIPIVDAALDQDDDGDGLFVLGTDPDDAQRKLGVWTTRALPRFAGQLVLLYRSPPAYDVLLGHCAPMCGGCATSAVAKGFLGPKGR